MGTVTVDFVRKTIRSEPGIKPGRTKVFCVVTSSSIGYGVVRKINPLSVRKHLIMRPQPSSAPHFLMRQLELNLTTHDHWTMESTTASLIVGLRRCEAMDVVLSAALFHCTPTCVAQSFHPASERGATVPRQRLSVPLRLKAAPTSEQIPKKSPGNGRGVLRASRATGPLSNCGHTSSRTGPETVPPTARHKVSR